MKPQTQPDQAKPVTGLRERKKARTKAAIQREAVRMFREQGYTATTIEQIAEAAEVAPSTVFRYFPTKQDLVFSHDYDLPFAMMLQAQSPDLTPIQAERRTIRSMLEDIPPEELALQRERWVLIISEPELWGASLGNMSRTMEIMSEQVAKRAGRDPGDASVRAYAGAVFGVMLQVSLEWAKNPEMDFAVALDEALLFLEDLRP
ncbi:TetR family transcriptional regulator [Streptomyces mobaraensis NBRC 13819 = DSM 40847]|uniref:TetR family transcriptional regulator n=1 Tax=Streptomyces mobaraensis (strain ATCC 29032 / DSM 40847 / JCM 4168 / NBRC 13819 / NCIMB 11159 / IPCR 16-22) TaxID=1223523 RepID=M3C890_STRM1|nr:TetR family transcriptional regulator [Streptomyces mobaraensis]EMF00187.1 TetR family transcriptional regulator [Streptomyces mobaraensis NBRC 13819 = DSM 40847]QTT72468.1 TetR family transcriptional regulator [Streptomyces mobaraensis NBRC 13819 = DSM 40847]